MSAPAMSVRSWALLVLLATLWGGSFFLSKLALAELPPFTIVGTRAVVAVIFLAVLLPLLGLPFPRGYSVWRRLFVIGLLNNAIPFGLIVWGQQFISTGLSALLNGTTPLFTVLLGLLLTRDRKPTLPSVGGIVLGLAGVAVLVGPGALAGIGQGIAGEIAVLGAALSYGFAALYYRHVRDIPAGTVAFGQLLCCAAVMMPLAFIFEQPLSLRPGPVSIGAIVLLGTLCTALAYFIYFRLLRVAGPTNASLVTQLNPVMAMLLGFLFLGEVPGWNAYAAMALIVAGFALVDGRILQRQKPSTSDIP